MPQIQIVLLPLSLIIEKLTNIKANSIQLIPLHKNVLCCMYVNIIIVNNLLSVILNLFYLNKNKFWYEHFFISQKLCIIIKLYTIIHFILQNVFNNLTLRFKLLYQN